MSPSRVPSQVSIGDTPAGPSAARVLQPSVNSFVSLWSRCEERWNSVQVGRQGSYSVERLESLDRYCKATSHTRVILVCLFTPFPSLAVAVLLECLPLRHPSEGWAANWVFWIRWTFMFLTISFVGVSQLVTYVPGLKFTLAKRVVVSVGSTVAFVGTSLLGASTVRFPLPFMLQLGSVVMGMYIAVLVRLVFTKKDFGSNSPCRLQLRRFYRFLFAYVVLGGVYPFCKVVFDATPTKYRGVVVLVLPVCTFAAKHFILKVMRELEDFIPELVAFTVDFFSALMVSACMTTSGSIYLSVMFIMGDLAQALLGLREVRTNAKVVLELLSTQNESRRKMKNESITSDLMAMLLKVLRDPRASRVTSLDAVRLRACLPHPLTNEQDQRLQLLEASGVYGMRPDRRFSTSRSTRKRTFHWFQTCFGGTASIVPVSRNQPRVAPSRHTNSYTRHKQADRSKTLVLQGLQLLFHCEYLVLVEYVECVVPLVFATYKSILEQLPNVVYYPGGAGSWGISALANMLVFAALQIMTFVLFVKFLQRKFSFSPLYQLAFVFETQVYLVQAKLLIEIVTLLQSKLAHFGGGYAANIDRNK